MFCPLRTLLTAVLWQSSDGLNGSGTPKGSTASTFKVFWVVLYQYQNVSILKDNLHLYLEHCDVSRILFEVGTLTVPYSLCLMCSKIVWIMNLNICGAFHILNCALVE